MTTQLIILPNGTHAREISPIDLKTVAKIKIGGVYVRDENAVDQYKAIEAKLKEYRIVSEIPLAPNMVNTIQNFEVNQEEGTAQII
jgi:hypothetical protein